MESFCSLHAHISVEDRGFLQIARVLSIVKCYIVLFDTSCFPVLCTKHTHACFTANVKSINFCLLRINTFVCSPPHFCQAFSSQSRSQEAIGSWFERDLWSPCLAVQTATSKLLKILCMKSSDIVCIRVVSFGTSLVFLVLC